MVEKEKGVIGFAKNHPLMERRERGSSKDWFPCPFFHKEFVIESRENYQEIGVGTCSWPISKCSVTTHELDSDLLWQLASLKETGEAITGGIDHFHKWLCILLFFCIYLD